MRKTISFSTTDKRVKRISDYVDDKHYVDTSGFINAAIDKLFELHEMNVTIDFLNFIAFPLFLFIITVGMVLIIPNLFFYILNGLSGIYLIVFVYLFFYKYRGVSWYKQ